MNQQPTPQPTQPTETPPQPTQPPQPTHQFSSQDPNVKAKHRITFFTKVTTPADRAKQRQLRIAIVALSTLVLIGLTLLTLFLTIWRRPVVTPPQPRFRRIYSINSKARPGAVLVVRAPL